jgi:hypothetical protein
VGLEVKQQFTRIERDRFWGVERDDRICDICTSNAMGDEYHYLEMQ